MCSIRTLALAFVALVLIPSAAPAATELRNVSILSPLSCEPNDRTIFYGSASDIEEETSLAVHPRDPRHLVVSWIQDSGLGVITAVTRDAGATWLHTVVPGLTTCTGGTYDRVVHTRLVFDPAGTLYLATTPLEGVFPDPRSAVARIAINRSTDGGASWEIPTFVDDGGAFNDFDTIAVEPSGALDVIWSPHEVYLEPIILSRSTDGGRTWTRHTVREARPTEIAFNRIVAHPSGALMVFIHDFAAPSFFGAPDDSPLSVARSLDGGDTWSTAQVAPDGVVDWPIAAVTPDGGVHVAWRTARGDGWEDVWMSHSYDVGSSWSSPTKIFERKPAGSPGLAMAANSAGELGIIYVDNRVDGADDEQDTVEVRVAMSSDAGATWRHCVTMAFDARPQPYWGLLQDIAGTPDGFVAAFPAGAPHAKHGRTDVYLATITREVAAAALARSAPRATSASVMEGC